MSESVLHSVASIYNLPSACIQPRLAHPQAISMLHPDTLKSWVWPGDKGRPYYVCIAYIVYRDKDGSGSIDYPSHSPRRNSTIPT